MRLMKFARARLGASVLLVMGCKSQQPELTPDSSFEEHVTIRPTERPAVIRFTSVRHVCPRPGQSANCTAPAGELPTRAFVTSSGHLVFFDRHNGLIEVDSAGNFVREIGELGKDPGSYIRVSALAANDDRTTIWDFSLGRATIYPRRGPPVAFRVRADGLAAVDVADEHVFALTFPAAIHAGDRVIGSLAPVNEKGLLEDAIAGVYGLAARSVNSDMMEIPSFYWPRPVWTVFANGGIAYVTPDTALRIEAWSPEGKPALLVTGHLPVADALVDSADVHAREAAFYKTVVKRDMETDRAECARTPNWRQKREIAFLCMMAAFVEKVGRRSPRIRPPVEDVVGVSPHELWIRTSAAAKDSVTWVVFGQPDHRLAVARLSRSERPIGRVGTRIAIADTARDRVTVTLRSYLTN